MEKNKYDFISELLEQKKLDPSQKERFLKLVSQELKNEFTTKEEIEYRLIAIEEKLGIEKQDLVGTFNDVDLIPKSLLVSDFSGIDLIKVQEIEKEIKNEIPNGNTIYLYPASLYKFLFEYNQNQILKSTCHEIDANALEVILEYCDMESYDFQKHFKKILDAYEVHEKNFAPPSIKALIRGYLTGKDFKGNELKQGWSSDKIKINWSYDILPSWTFENHNLPPNSITKEFIKNKTKGFDLLENGFTSQINGKRVQTFRELVLHFKSLFHIRAGEESLHKIIVSINERENWNETIDFVINEEYFPMNIELFTNVDKLIQAYKKFIELVIEQHPKDSKPVVKLAFYENDSNVYFTIHHLNNTYNKTIQNVIDRMNGQTYTNLIKYQINGMCNLYLKADFGREGIAGINLWNGKERSVIKDGLDDFIGGVEHILEFCKK